MWPVLANLILNAPRKVFVPYGEVGHKIAIIRGTSDTCVSYNPGPGPLFLVSFSALTVVVSLLSGVCGLI
jgi:hypothetical protein